MGTTYGVNEGVSDPGFKDNKDVTKTDGCFRLLEFKQYFCRVNLVLL